MKFDELEARMRAIESARDPCAAPEVFLVARIDGRGFTRLTGEVMKFEKPYDELFRDHMIATVAHLMDCGFRTLFGYTQSDEISLLFDAADGSFGRNIRKWTSILAGEASGCFSARIGRPAAFDCRIVELPTPDLVVDYFRWRGEDARRNARNGWCYWTLRGQGCSAADATSRLMGMSIEQKDEVLLQRGVRFDALPAWQLHGAGVLREEYDKPSVNPLSGEAVVARRRRLRTILELPLRDEMNALIRGIVRAASNKQSE